MSGGRGCSRHGGGARVFFQRKGFLVSVYVFFWVPTNLRRRRRNFSLPLGTKAYRRTLHHDRGSNDDKGTLAVRSDLPTELVQAGGSIYERNTQIGEIRHKELTRPTAS